MRRARLESPALESPEELLWLRGEESLGALFRYELQISPADPGALRGREAELLRSPITLVFEENGEEVGVVHGIVGELRLAISASDRTGSLRLTLVPRLFALSQVRSTQIFLDRTLPQIIGDKLAAHGFEEGVDFALGLRGQYPAREFVVQYQESDLAFLCRLCEHAGVTFFFRHGSGRDLVVFADSPEVYEPANVHDSVVHYHPSDDRRGAFEIEESWKRVPERVLVHDYNYRTPQLEQLAARTTDREVALGAVVDYGVHTKTPDETRMIARVRAEEIAAGQHVVHAKTRELSLRAGHTFTLVHAAGAEQQLLVTRVVSRSHLEGAGQAREDRLWHNEIEAIPAKVPFRPPRNTPRPRVTGLIHAVIDGAIRGPYAEIDEAGRYKVRFRYDLAGRPDLHATHRIRMMQPHAGARYGMHFPLRPGTEVLVGFIEGDPDRPIIVGTAPNPVTPSPVEQVNTTHNVLRTGSGNEMVLDDLLEQERIRLHTPNENTTLQLGYVEEPELGAILRTDASITEASGVSNNESTSRKVLLAQTQASLVADTSVLIAGVPGIDRAAERGMQELSAVAAQRSTIQANLRQISRPVGDPEAPDPGSLQVEPGLVSSEGDGFSELWSDLGESLADEARDAAIAAVRVIAEARDTDRAESMGRREGEPLGQPGAPAVILASPETAALLGRSRALLYGERVASVSSHDTASLIGGQLAELRSPQTVEVAGAMETLVTSAGTLDMASKLLRVVAGYYPEKEAPELDDGTSIGVMARRDLRITSIEDCILICAHKNLVAAAHTGDMRLKAQKTVSITGGSVTASGGYIGLSSGGDVCVEAGGDLQASASGNIVACAGGDASLEAGGTVTIKGGTVIIEGGTITLNGPVTVCGDLTVTGSINGG